MSLHSHIETLNKHLSSAKTTIETSEISDEKKNNYKKIVKKMILLEDEVKFNEESQQTLLNSVSALETILDDKKLESLQDSDLEQIKDIKGALTAFDVETELLRQEIEEKNKAADEEEKKWKGSDYLKTGLKIAGGISTFLLIRRGWKKLKSWFGGKKEGENKETKEKDKKEKKMGFFKKLLIGIGIIGTGAAVYHGVKNPEKVKGFFGKIGDFFSNMREGISNWTLFESKEDKNKRITKAKELASSDDAISYDAEEDEFVYREERIDAKSITTHNNPNEALKTAKTNIDTKLDTNPQDPDIDDTQDKLEENAEKLKNYNIIGGHINSFYTNLYTTKLSSEYTDKYQNLLAGGPFLLGTQGHEMVDGTLSPGLMVAQLDTHYGYKIDNLFRAEFFDMMLAMADEKSFTNWLKAAQQKTEKSAVMLLQNIIKSAIPDNPLFDPNDINWISRWVEKKEENLSYLQSAAKQFLKIQNYFGFVKEQYEYELAKKALAEHYSAEWSNKTKVEQESWAHLKLQDDEFYTQHIETQLADQFLNKSIIDFYTTQSVNNPDFFASIQDHSFDKKTQSTLTRYSKEKLDYVEKIISYTEADSIDREEFLTYSKGLKTRMEQLSYQSRYSIFTETFGLISGNSEEKDALMKATGYELYLKQHTSDLETLIKKTEGTGKVPGKVPNDEELKKLIVSVDHFYDSLTDLTLGTNFQMKLEEGVDEDKKKVWYARCIFPRNIVKGTGQLVVMKFKEGKEGQSLLVAGVGLVTLDFATLGLLSGGIEKVFKNGTAMHRMAKRAPANKIRKLGVNQFKLRAGDIRKNKYASKKRMRPFGSAKIFKGKEAELFAKIGTGDISFTRAKEILISNKSYGSTAITEEYILAKRLDISTTDLKLKIIGEYIRKHGDEDILHRGLLNKIKDSERNIRKLPWQKYSYSLNDNAYQVIENVMKKKYPVIKGIPKGAQKSFMVGLIKNAPDINNKALVQLSQQIGHKEFTQFFKLAKSQLMYTEAIQFESFGVKIAKYMGNFDDITEFKKFLKVVKANSGQMKNTEHLIENLATTRKSGNYKFNAKNMLLNKTQINKLSIDPPAMAHKQFKADIAKETRKLKKQIPFSNQKASLKIKLARMKNLAKVDFKTFRALSFGPAEWMGTIGKIGIKQISDISKLLKNDTDFLKKISKLKDAKKIKAEFASKLGRNIEIPDEFMHKIGKLKSYKAIDDFVDYTGKIGSIDDFKAVSKGVAKFKNIITSPGMKFIARNVMRSLVAIGFVFGAIDVVSMLRESEKISKTNLERGKNKRQEAYTTAGLYGLSAGLMFIPGIGWVGAAVIAGSTAIGDFTKQAYFETRDKSLKNYEDFQKYDSSLLIKEHIVWALASTYGTDRGWKNISTQGINRANDNQHIINPIGYGIDKLLGYTGITDQPQIKNSLTEIFNNKLNSASNGTKGLLYLDELKKHPLGRMTFLDTADDKLMTTLEDDPTIQQYLSITRKEGLVEFIGSINDEIRQHVNKRYLYLINKLNNDSGNKDEKLQLSKIINKNTIENNTAINILDKLIQESSYATLQGTYQGKSLDLSSYEKVENYKKNLLNDLKSDPERYKKLQSFFESHDSDFSKISDHLEKTPAQLLYYFQKTAHSDLLYKTDAEGNIYDPSKNIIDKNLAYLNKFMSYKHMNGEININEYITKTDKESELTTDYVQIRKFLLDLETIENTPIDEEYSEYVPQLQLERSESPMQNILYRIAKEVIGDKFAFSENEAYRLNNTEQDIKRFFSETYEKQYGIYFNSNGDLNINGDLNDTTFENRKDPKNLKKIKKEIELQIVDMGGDMIDLGTGNKYLNKEIGKKILKIFDEEMIYYTLREHHKKTLKEHIKTQSNGKRVSVSISDQILAFRSGLHDFNHYLYKWNIETKKFERKYKNTQNKNMTPMLFGGSGNTFKRTTA